MNLREEGGAEGPQRKRAAAEGPQGATVSLQLEELPETAVLPVFSGGIRSRTEFGKAWSCACCLDTAGSQ